MMIDVLLGGVVALTALVLVLVGLAIERLSQPKCRHQWRTVAKAHAPETEGNYECTTVLLACDDCGKTEQHKLLGEESQ